MTNECTEKKQGIQSDKDFTSNRISDLSRYIAFGILGSIFILISAGNSITKGMLGSYRAWTVAIILAGLIAVFSDYLQYLFGYYCSKRAAESADLSYDQTWVSYRLRQFFFVVMQLSAGVAGVLFVI